MASPLTLDQAVDLTRSGDIWLFRGRRAPDRAIRAVAAGEAIFGAGVVQAVVDFSASPSTPFPGLTAREREVLDLMAAGHRNHAIAGQLFLSPKTVANHVSSIFAKLGVTDRSEAIVRARREGFGEP